MILFLKPVAKTFDNTFHGHEQVKDASDYSHITVSLYLCISNGPFKRPFDAASRKYGKCSSIIKAKFVTVCRGTGNSADFPDDDKTFVRISISHFLNGIIWNFAATSCFGIKTKFFRLRIYLVKHSSHLSIFYFKNVIGIYTAKLLGII